MFCFFFYFKDIPNILIISPSSTERVDSKREIIDGTSFDLITSTFVGQSDNTNTRILDTYTATTQKFTKNADLFPDKFSNLHKRIVRLALFNYKPYTIWEEVV